MIEYASPRFRAPLFHRHGRAVAEDIRVSCHEASHTILRWENGREISKITINPQEIDGRQINGRVQGGTRLSVLSDDAELFCRITELVAGNVGEQLFLGECRGLRGSDRKRAHFYASALCGSEIAIGHLIDAAEAEAFYVLDRYRHILDALVNRLCEVRVLSGTEVLALIKLAGGQA
jgi:hypothetical protein